MKKNSEIFFFGKTNILMEYLCYYSQVFLQLLLVGGRRQCSVGTKMTELVSKHKLTFLPAERNVKY